MSIVDANRTTEAFLDAREEAQAMAGSGRVGADFDDLLRHAKELLEVLDEELAPLDPHKHADLLAAAPLLRHKLERLRDELRGGIAHEEGRSPPV